MESFTATFPSFSLEAQQRSANAAMSRMQALKTRLPDWMQDWLEIIIPGAQIVLIVLAAWLLQHALRRLVQRATTRYQLPDELAGVLNGLVRWIIMASALLLVLERMGVSATVLWTAFTGFATVGAVAFFAAWSVLSNLFCALLIFTVRPYRIGDHIEVLDTAEKVGAIGRVVDINLLYTTLEDHSTTHGTAWLQIPNALIFQRVVRRYQNAPPPAVPTPLPTMMLVPAPIAAAVTTGAAAAEEAAPAPAVGSGSVPSAPVPSPATAAMPPVQAAGFPTSTH